MTAVVPSTGTRTAVPGHNIVSSKRKHAATTMARPAHATAARTVAGIRRTCDPTMASSAPASSSPMRVGRRKNAHDGYLGVIHAARAKPRMPTATTVTSTSRRYWRGAG
jgi:hypothetical protein